MSLLGATAIASGVLNLGKGIVGAIQASKGRKEMNKLLNNPVVYKRPEEYDRELQQRRQMAEQTRLPGQGYIEQNIGQATSQALNAAERGAISSNVYQSSVGDIYQKQLDAFQNLGLQAAQYQQQQKENYLNTLQRGAGYSDQEFAINKLQPWEMKMNIAQGNRQAGNANLWGGIEGAIGNVMDYAGTKYMGDVMKGMVKGMSGLGNTTGRMPNPNQVFSKPLADINRTAPLASFARPNVNWTNTDNYLTRFD